MTVLLYGLAVLVAGAAVWRELERLAKDAAEINRRADIDRTGAEP